MGVYFSSKVSYYFSYSLITLFYFALIKIVTYLYLDNLQKLDFIIYIISEVIDKQIQCNIV